MHDSIKQMLNKYTCRSQKDYLNALKEIFQEIALLGLWRSKFYEKAAFYGGSSLRILYGLDRFSEDLDFTLLGPDEHFKLDFYNKAIANEFKGFGFDVFVVKKEKSNPSSIESAFIKAESKTQLIHIETPDDFIRNIHHQESIQIKMEVDINPPGRFETEAKTILQPIPFSVKTMNQPCLFAGKVHAMLCRPGIARVKGRDWYDFVWYVARQMPLDITHLRARLIQSQAWEEKASFGEAEVFLLLKEKINQVDFELAKRDVRPFLKDAQSVELWSTEFFIEIARKIIYVPSRPF